VPRRIGFNPSAKTPVRILKFLRKNLSVYNVVLPNRNASPGAVFSYTVRAVLSSYHKRAMPMNFKDLDKVSLYEAFDFYKERFADAS
jgi:zinc protease